MGSQVAIHEEQPTIATTNLSLKSIAYNNDKNYRNAIRALTLNTTYINNANLYTNKLTTITKNLSTAANLLMGCIGSLMKAQNRASTYNTIRAKYGLGGIN